jgi:SAM-dependent methyltransferase
MNRTKFSTIAHGDHLFANPVSAAKIDQVLGLLDLQPGAQVLDVGCGNAELLLRLIERFDVVGVGVDPNAAALDEARRRAAGRVPSQRLQLHQQPIAEFDAQEGAYAAGLCVGSTHAYGDYLGTLAALKRLVAPGGLLVIGEGYWKQTPDPEYLMLLGAAPGDLTDHATNVTRAVAAGLIPLYSVVSNDDEWDHYEGLYCRAIERYIAAHADDADSAEFSAYIRRWYAGYLRWGRATLGFGLYVFATQPARR